MRKKNNEKITIWLNPKNKNRLHVISENLGLTHSALVETLLEEYFPKGGRRRFRIKFWEFEEAVLTGEKFFLHRSMNNSQIMLREPLKLDPTEHAWYYMDGTEKIYFDFSDAYRYSGANTLGNDSVKMENDLQEEYTNLYGPLQQFLDEVENDEQKAEAELIKKYDALQEQYRQLVVENSRLLKYLKGQGMYIRYKQAAKKNNI